MIFAGHNLASLRKSELDHLASLLGRISPMACSDLSMDQADTVALDNAQSAATPWGSSIIDDTSPIWSSANEANLTELAEMLNFDGIQAQDMFPLMN